MWETPSMENVSSPMDYPSGCAREGHAGANLWRWVEDLSSKRNQKFSILQVPGRPCAVSPLAALSPCLRKVGLLCHRGKENTSWPVVENSATDLFWLDGKILRHRLLKFLAGSVSQYPTNFHRDSFRSKLQRLENKAFWIIEWPSIYFLNWSKEDILMLWTDLLKCL